jgi:hypothetical protein
MPGKTANTLLVPGDFARHPGRCDWGLGQVQSRIGPRITVNFEHAGKVTIDGNVVELEPAVSSSGGPSSGDPRRA